MKNILLLIIILTTFVSCENPSMREKMNKRSETDVMNTYFTTTIDSCEYIVYKASKTFGITHKGNCKNH